MLNALFKREEVHISFDTAPKSPSSYEFKDKNVFKNTVGPFNISCKAEVLQNN